jgi:hypothetical protein
LATLKVWDGTMWHPVGGSIAVAGVMPPLTMTTGGVLDVLPATSTTDGTMSPSDFTKLSGMPAISSVARPLTLAGGVLDIQQASPTLEGSMLASDFVKVQHLSTYNADLDLGIYSPSRYVFSAARSNNHMTSNAYWDGASWQRWNTAGPSSIFYTRADAEGFGWSAAPAGTGIVPTTTMAALDRSGFALSDTNAIFQSPGGYAMGAWPGDTNWAALWKTNQGSAPYILMAHNNGSVLLNSPGAALYFRNAQVDIATISAGGLTLMANKALVGSGAIGSYGGLTIQGSKNGWAGLGIRRGSDGAQLGTLMVSDSGSQSGWGMYNSADNAWVSYWANGVYQALSATTIVASGLITAQAGVAAVNGTGLYAYQAASGTPYGRFYQPGQNLHIDTFGGLGGGSTYINWFGGGSVIIGNGAGANGPLVAGTLATSDYVNARRLVANNGTQGSTSDAGAIIVNDIIVYRSGNTGVGVVYLRADTARYLFYDATYYQLPGSNTYLNGVAYGSDAAMKRDIEPLPRPMLAAVRAIRPSAFNWREEHHSERERQFGFVKQDIEPHLPELVTPNLIGANGEVLYGGYELGGMLATLWQAVRELTDEVDQLKVQLKERMS